MAEVALGAELRRLIAFSKDGEWGTDEPVGDSLEVAVIRGTDFDAAERGRLDSVPVRYVSKPKALAKALVPDDIVIETAGGTKGRPTGRTVLIRQKWLAHSPRPVLCASFCRSIRIDPTLAHPPYVYWWLRSLHASGRMAAFNTQHTGVSRFQWTDFASATRVALPSAETQRRVAAVLTSFDELVAVNERRILLLEELARALHTEWFVRFRAPGANQGEPPVEWDVHRLGELAEVITSGVDPRDVDLGEPYVGLEHISRRSTTLRDWGSVESVISRKLRFQSGDSLFGKIRPYFHKVAWAPFDGVTSSDTIVVRPIGDVRLPGLINAVLASDELVARAVATSNGTKMPRADPRVLLDHPITLPPLEGELVRDFEAAVGSVLRLASILVAQNRALVRARDLMLPRLIVGRVDVSRMGLSDLEVL